MATDRVIKTDGDLDITATDTSISGTLNVSGQATLSGLAYPTSDGTADQALVTNGSGVLSFADVASGGVDTITSASEASSYSGTASIIYITSSADVTFTTNLYDRLIIVNQCNVTIQDANIADCIFTSPANLTIENTSTNGSTDVLASRVKMQLGGDLLLDASGNTSGNQVKLLESDVYCEAFTPTDRANTTYVVNDCRIRANRIFDGGDATNNLDLSTVSLDAYQVSGEINLPADSGTFINVRKESLTGTKIKIAGTTYIDGAYAYPFKVDQNGIDTKVVVKAYPNVTSQSITTTDATKITLAGTHIDNTSSFDATTNYRFTAKVKGEYLVMPKVFLDSVNTDVVFEARTNGVSSNTDNIYSAYVDSASRVVNGAMIIDLDVNDYLEFYSDSASDTSYTINNALTVVSIKKIN